MSFRKYYDTSKTSSYGRSRDSSATRAASTTSTERPTTVTAKYLSPTPSYKSSIPVLRGERSAKDETPISAIASKYANYGKKEKLTPTYEKKDYTKLTVPVTRKSRESSPVSSSKYKYTTTNGRSRDVSPEPKTKYSMSSIGGKSRDLSPVTSSSKYSYTRPSRHLSPGRLTTKTLKEKSPDPSTSNRDKDIPSKTDKLSSYSSLTSLYSNKHPRTSNYSRPASRAEVKPDISINRYAIANRLASNYSPTVKLSSVSPVNHSPSLESPKFETEKSVSPLIIIEEKENSPVKEIYLNKLEVENGVQKEEFNEIETENVIVITRHTSPTPPGSSAYVRSRRADMAKTTEKTITRLKNRPEMVDKEIQSDRLDDPTRSSRFGSTARSSVTSWSLYPSSSYTGYAGRYSTKYTTTRDNSSGNSYSDRASRSTSTEPPPIENISRTHSPSDNTKSSSVINSSNLETNKEMLYYDEKKESDNSNMSEMVINVNFTLKSPKILTQNTAELVSPEVTITNSLLPPQAPKPEGTVKAKKKIRKSSTDSSSDSSSKKKVVKKKIKSVSSSDSEQVSDASQSDKNKGLSSVSLSKSITKISSSSNLSKLKQKSRESNSPESSMTQSSMSEDETTSRSKTVDISRTSADETSLQTDASLKQSSPLQPQRNDEGTEEAKSFLIRALAPVATLFKLRHQESSENSRWPDISSSDSTGKDVSNLLTESDKSSKTKNIIASNEDGLVQLKKIRHVESGERAWWLDSSSNIPEGIERLSPPRKSSSDSDKSEKYNFFKVRHIESGEKDWWLTSNSNETSSLSNNKDAQISLSKSSSDHKRFSLGRIRHIESGERAWWLSSDKNIPEGIEKLPTPPPPEESDTSDSEEVQEYITPSHIPPFPLQLPDDEPLGDRRSPEGLETPKENENFRGRTSPYENNHQYRRKIIYQKGMEKYISRYTDIDDILGTSGQIYSPFMDSILARRTGMPFEEECEEIDPTQVRIHDSTPQRPVITKLRGRNEIASYRGEDELDDATLQIFKDGDYGPYLDLDSTLGEQEEEIEGLQDNRKNALVLRTQLPVRVHGIIEKLLHSQGRELRRTLFSLKQILQSDKDLVHDFVANKGLDCLMQVGNLDDQNYIDYILRALGQILLYVDGMHGVMGHKKCVQWLYSLISSKFRHVVKTALKLLVVFVEYTDKNSVLLIEAINVVDSSNGRPPWYNLMKILQDIDASDTELLIYATTLINLCLNNVPDRELYYDQVDALQDQSMDEIIQLYMTKQGTDLDLLRQLQIFEAVLLLEDGDESGTAIKQLDESVINSVRRRGLNVNSSEKRRSKKRQIQERVKAPVTVHSDPKPKITNNNRPQFLPSILDNNKESKELLSTALRRRRDRYARQAHHIIQQQELLNNSNGIYNGLFGNTNGAYNLTNGNVTSSNTNYINGSYLNTNSYQIIKDSNELYYNGNGINGHDDDAYINRTVKNLNLADVLINGNQRYTAGLKQRIQNGTLGHSVTAVDALSVIRHKQLDGTPEVKDDRGILLNREHSIKDLAQRLTSPVSPTTEDKQLRVAEMAGIVSKAKEELAKSQSKEVIKSPSVEKSPKVHELKISENELHWEELRQGCLKREYHLCDLDFSDLRQDSDDEMLSQNVNASNGPPPPPPGMFLPLCNPPPLPGFPSVQRNSVPPPPVYSSELMTDSDSSTIKKNKKTVKLFWREIQENPAPAPLRSKVGGFIWDDLPEVPLDTKILEHLFESRTNDLIIKKLMEPKRNLILDTKRSNAINIAMKKLPTPQTIKAAIMKMDANVIGREGIEKLLTMLPTEEEKVKIQEAQYANPDLPLGSAEQFLLTLAPNNELSSRLKRFGFIFFLIFQYANPDLPLGSAEQFLLTLASINELSSRLKLWVFKLDFDNSEKEIAEPLMDLKQGMELLKVNKTFKVILSTLRSVGSFLNGNQVKGFRLEYLSKVMEVKDTVHKHPLLHHICEMIIEKFPDTTDFFSEMGPVIRASKVDFDILANNLMKLETDCKASWDHMKRIAKHDGSQIFKTKINEFLTDAAERIILLSIIRKRVMSRYDKFLLYLGVPTADIGKTKASEFLKVIAEFALEYRTTRERVLQQLEKRANHRERNKTRGKMIIDVGNYSNKIDDVSADSALKELLRTDPSTDSLAEGRRKAQNRRTPVNGEIITADDEIIESLVRSATSKRKPITRERRRNRLCDQKNYFNRTLDGHQWPSPETSNGATAATQHR